MMLIYLIFTAMKRDMRFIMAGRVAGKAYLLRRSCC
nr:MAG TPA_asm: hypothetical protein [Caudoviricetes sp.]